MTKDKLYQIKRYCNNATAGPWSRSGVAPKLVTSNWKDVCRLASGSHMEDWRNFHFIANARQDLPQLAEYCLLLLKRLEAANSQLQLERANRKLEASVAQEHLKRVRTVRTELEKKRELLEQERNSKSMQFELLNRQLEVERSMKKLELDHLKRELEVERAKQGEELEKARKQLEAEASVKQKELEKARKQLELERAKALELFERDMGYSKGMCDQLLDDLDKVEAALHSAEQAHRHAQGWDRQDPVVRARNLVVAESEESQSQPSQPQAQAQPQEAPAVEQPQVSQGDLLEDVADYQTAAAPKVEDVMPVEEAPQVETVQEAPAVEAVAEAPAAEAVEEAHSDPAVEPMSENVTITQVTGESQSAGESDMGFEDETQTQRQERLGIEKAQEAVSNFIASDDEENVPDMDGLLDELDRTEASLNQWSGESVGGYGRFGENVIQAAKAASEFIAPAESPQAAVEEAQAVEAEQAAEAEEIATAE